MKSRWNPWRPALPAAGTRSKDVPMADAAPTETDRGLRVDGNRLTLHPEGPERLEVAAKAD